MTMILSLATPTLVLQVSDRRASFVQRSRIVPRDDLTNKAVVYDGRVCFAITGVTEVLGERTDIWLAKVLAEAGALDKGFELLRQRCTEAFSRGRMKGLPLGVVAAGWSYRPPDGRLAPFYSVISNFFVNGQWVRNPLKRFLWALDVAPDKCFELFSAGRELSEVRRRNLKRNLRRAMERRVDVGNAVRLMTEEIRRRASFDTAVGKDILVNCIPRGAVNPSGASSEVMIMTGQPVPNISTFQYLPAGDSRGITYGPTFVSGGTVMSDFESGPLRPNQEASRSEP